jgi:hypothetical protein
MVKIDEYLYMTIVNDDARIKLQIVVTSFYSCKMFTVKATGVICHI